MHLYEKQSGNINVYELLPIFWKIRKYKTNHSHNFCILEAKTNASSNNRLLEVANGTITHREVNSFNGNYHILEAQKFFSDNIKSAFIDGKYDKNKLLRIVNKINNEQKVLHYLLLTSNHYESKHGSCSICMENIINLSKEIYILELMLQDRLIDIANEDIDEQLALFDSNDKPIYTTTESELRNLINVGIMENNFEEIEQKIDISHKILTKVRKKNA